MLFLDATWHSIKLQDREERIFEIRRFYDTVETQSWDMYPRLFPTTCLSFFFLFWSIAVCAAAQPALPYLLDTGCHNLYTNLPRPLIPEGFALSPTNFSSTIDTERATWRISDTLSLALVICSWQPSPETIQAVLAAAATSIGKKPAAGLLEQKFVQRSDNKYNTLYFEISPGHVYKRLTWGDIGEVLGEHGLPEFFRTTRLWHTVYFVLIHATRGELGEGAVRRWWQLEFSSDRNVIAIANNRVIEVEKRSGT